MSFTVHYAENFEQSVSRNIREANKVSKILERLIANEELLGLEDDGSEDAIYGKLEDSLRWVVLAKNKCITKRRIKDLLSPSELALFKKHSNNMDGQMLSCYSDSKELKVNNFIYAIEAYTFQFFDVCLFDGFTMAFPMSGVYFSNFELFSQKEKEIFMTEQIHLETERTSEYLINNSDIKDQNLSQFICNYKIL